MMVEEKKKNERERVVRVQDEVATRMLQNDKQHSLVAAGPVADTFDPVAFSAYDYKILTISSVTYSSGK